MSVTVRNKIISDLFLSKDFNDCIKKMQPEHLQDDLKAEVALILCEHSDEKIISIHESSPLSLKYYTVRIILNLIQSKTSPFYKKYRTPITEFTDSHEQADVEDDFNARLKKETSEQKVLDIIDGLYWYDKEMLNLYMEVGSYRKMQAQTGIPWQSCYDAVQSAYSKIRYELRTNKN